MDSLSTLLLIHLDRVDSDVHFGEKVVQSDEVYQRCHQNTKRFIFSDTPDSLPNLQDKRFRHTGVPNHRIPQLLFAYTASHRYRKYLIFLSVVVHM